MIFWRIHSAVRKLRKKIPWKRWHLDMQFVCLPNKYGLISTVFGWGGVNIWSSLGVQWHHRRRRRRPHYHHHHHHHHSARNRHLEVFSDPRLCKLSFLYLRRRAKRSDKKPFAKNAEEKVGAYISRWLLNGSDDFHRGVVCLGGKWFVTVGFCWGSWPT